MGWPNEKDVLPHRYYVTLKRSRKASNDDDDSITKILLYPAFKVKFGNLKPQGSYYFSLNAERCGHHTPESPTKSENCNCTNTPSNYL